jgi:hypothetical protein
VKAARGVVGDTRGVVYVEFLIAFMPVFVLFLSLVQLVLIEMANLVAKHAAVTAARAAMVVLPDDPAHYGGAAVERAEGQRLDDIKLAAKVPLMAIDALPDVDVKLPTSAGGTDSRTAFWRDDVVRVRLEYNFPCKVPIGKTLVCGLLARHTLVTEAAMPNQGADYEYAQ